MKKFWMIFCLTACLIFVLAVPAFADTARTGKVNDYTNRNIGNSVPDTGMRPDNGTVDTTRGFDANNDTALNVNNYRTNAVDDNDMNWSWLGLLGLLGLMGLRGRDRERT